MKESVDPASRLVAILERFIHQNGTGTQLEAWANTFDVQSKEPGVVISYVGEVLVLAGEARALVLKTVGEQKKELHEGPFNRLARVLSKVHFAAKADQVIAEVGACLETGVRHSADLITRLDFAEAVNMKTLESLQQDVESLYSDLLNSELSQPAKDLLVVRLDALRHAIVDIRLYGPAHVEEAVDALFGVVVRNQIELKSTKEGSGLLDRLVAVAEKGYSVVVFADKAIKLAEIAFKQITGG